MTSTAIPGEFQAMSRPGICVVGSSNYDLTTYVPRLPRSGETLRASGIHMGFGGKGANQAVMAAGLGAEVIMVTKLGKDVFGEDTLKNFQRFGVDTRHVLFTDEAASGVAAIAVEPDGTNSIMVAVGANELLRAADVELARRSIGSARVTVCQLEVPVETTLEALRIAREEGVTTILNPAPYCELPEGCYELCDVLCPNENEAAELTGRPAGTPEEAERASRSLLDRGARNVIVTLGERGCLLATGGEFDLIPAPAVDAVDTTGAGDAFVGSLAFYLAAGLALGEAVRRSNSIAAMSVQAAGTQSSFPSAAELPPELLAGMD